MAEVTTITQAIGKVLRWMILGVNCFSPLRRLRDKKGKQLLALGWDLEGAGSSEEGWRCLPEGLRGWSSCCKCWETCKCWASGTSQGQGMCSRRNLWLISAGEYLDEKAWSIINPLILFIRWLLPPSTGGFYAGFPIEIRKLDIKYYSILFCIWFELLNGF